MAYDYTTIASQLGVSIWLLIIVMIWEGVWKLLALWKSARKGSIIWFVVLALTNTLGILPILYIFIFSKWGEKLKKKSNKKK